MSAAPDLAVQSLSRDKCIVYMWIRPKKNAFRFGKPSKRHEWVVSTSVFAVSNAIYCKRILLLEFTVLGNASDAASDHHSLAWRSCGDSRGACVWSDMQMLHERRITSTARAVCICEARSMQRLAIRAYVACSLWMQKVRGTCHA